MRSVDLATLDPGDLTRADGSKVLATKPALQAKSPQGTSEGCVEVKTAGPLAPPEVRVELVQDGLHRALVRPEPERMAFVDDSSACKLRSKPAPGRAEPFHGHDEAT